MRTRWTRELTTCTPSTSVAVVAISRFESEVEDEEHLLSYQSVSLAIAVVDPSLIIFEVNSNVIEVKRIDLKLVLSPC